MRFRDIAPTVIVVCGFVAAIWSPLAWLAFSESFPRGWQPDFPHTVWTEFQGLFGFTALLFMPIGWPIGALVGNDTIGFTIGGAIEGAFGGLILSAAFAAIFGQWHSPNAAI